MAKRQAPQRARTATTELCFSEDHLWLRVDAKRATIGISDFGQSDLGDVIAAELPDIGDSIERGEPFGELESTRTVQELLAPASGKVRAVNTEIETTPSLINEDPYHEGWLIEIELDAESELDDLMTADAYEELLAREEDD